ncbi:desulfoferrodoxin [Fusibacter sp. JL298sf-3]
MKRLDVYKCEKCGIIVEVLQTGAGTLVCCGENMVKLDEKSADSTVEKHVPMVEAVDGGYKVTVGSTLHPMKDEHYIQWIELVTESETLIAFLKPGDEPVATFKTDSKAVLAREYCNLHGLWKNEM